jgi:antitoxin (DNA-binding transcriptional repressor) of toxin-antitoxin stability system
MNSITDTDLRENLARYLDQVVTDYDPIVVTRQGKADAAPPQSRLPRVTRNPILHT